MNFPSVGRVKPMVPRAMSVSVSAELRPQCFHFPPLGFTITVIQNFHSALFSSFSEFHPTLLKWGKNRYTSTPLPDAAFDALTSMQITPTGSVWWCHLVSEPTVGMRRGTFPTILPPPPASSVRSPLPANMKEAKVREDRLERCSNLTLDAVTVEFREWHQISVFIPAPQFLLRQTYGRGVRLLLF